MNFKERQQVRVSKRRRQQRKNAILMRRLGGYNSTDWQIHLNKVYAKVLKHTRSKQLGISVNEV